MAVNTRILAAYYPTLQDAFTEAATHGSATVYVDRPLTVSDHLYLSGGTNLECVGDGKITLTQEPTNGFYWIVCGTKGFGATPGNGLVQAWTGRMDNVVLAQSYTSTNLLKAINLQVVDGVEIKNCTGEFDTILNATGFIGGYNNSAFYTGGPTTRKNITIRDTRHSYLHSASLGNEGIGIGDADRVTIDTATILNCGDDVVAVHWCTNFAVRNVWGEPLDGRILVESATDGEVTGCTVKRVADPVGGGISSVGAHFMTELTRTVNNTRPAPARVLFDDNTVIHNDGITAAVYGMRLLGAKDCQALNNHFRGGGGLGYGVTWEEQTVAGWVDPTGEEVDSTARNRRLQIGGNTYDGDVASALATETEQGTPQPGPVWRDSTQAPVTVDVTGDGAATSFTVAHLLAEVHPSSITVLAPDGRILGEDAYDIQSVNGAGFQVNFAVAPGLGEVHTFKVSA